MRKINRTCVICGKGYSYCMACGEDRNKPAWMNSFCSENCKEVYHACAGKFANTMTKEEARAILDTCDLSHKDEFKESAQNMIKEIYGDTTMAQPKEEVKEAVVQSAKPETSIVAETNKKEELNTGAKYEAQKPVFKPKNKKNR